jgi:selenocysteine-specific elongation factor
MKSVIVGTAGHIDHGKTSLVKALTGIDADRLEEEKRRGITIDIGFAHLEMPASNGERLRFGFVDVPGHERFVRNMLAGVGGIDLVLLVIASDEGIKPQTREHFDICRLLAVPRGITVLTKSDAVDAETLEVVRLEVEDFLRGSFLDPQYSPIIAVSSLTGAGLDELRSALSKVATEISSKDSSALARLPIDRVFTMKGFGTVVTGTLLSGTISKEDELEVFPSSKRLRVRGVQVHGASADQAIAGQRTALNLAAVATEDLARGMTLASPETFHPTMRLDVSLTLLPSAKALKDRARVHFHAYTMETIAEVHLHAGKKVAPGHQTFASLRLAEPTLLLPGDRFILRQFSPVITIGGGAVLDALPLTKRRNQIKAENVVEFLGVQGTARPDTILEARVARRGKAGLSLAQATAETGWRKEFVLKHLAEPIQKKTIRRIGDMLVSTAAFDHVTVQLVDHVAGFHKTNPLVAGIGKEELRDKFQLNVDLFAAAVDALVHAKKLDLAGELIHLHGRGVVMKDEEAESKRVIEQAFVAAGLKVPSLQEVLAGLKVDKARAQKIVTLLLREKTLVKISDDLVFHQSTLAALRLKITALKATSPKIDVARFKDLTAVTRKYAIPLLEYLDREHVTRRVGDERVIL